MTRPRRIVQGHLPPKSPPPFARGPSPAATAAKPMPPPADTRLPPTHIRRSHGVRPPAASAVPMRAPAASSGGTSEDFQQIPCHSIPHPPPEAVRPCPSCILGLASPQRSPLAGCVYAVGQGVDSGRQPPFGSHVVSPFSRFGGCRLRWTLRTPCGPSRLAKQVRLRNLEYGEQARWAGF